MYKELFAGDKIKGMLGFIANILAKSNGKFILGDEVR